MGDYRVTLGVEFTGQSVLDNVQKQINNLTNNPKKVNLQIDTSSVSSQINNVQNQLKNIGNIKINVGNNGSSSGINQLYKNLDKLSGINLSTTYQQISNMERALDNFGFDKSSIQNVVKDLVNMNVEISKITTNMQQNGAVRINIQGTDSIGRTVNSIREVMQVAGEGSVAFETQIRNLGTTISQTFRTSADEAKENANAINTAYQEVISTINQMGSVQNKISVLDPTKNANEISALTNQLTDLQTKYTNLRSTFDAKFDASQLNGLDEALKKIQNDLSLTNAKSTDKSILQQKKTEIQEITNAYNELIKIQNQIGSTKTSLVGLDPTKNANEISALSQQLLKLKTDYDTLYLTFEKKFSTQQLDNLTNSFDVINNKITLLNSRNIDSNAIQQQVNAYKELLSIAKQMGNIELKIGSLKSVDGNVNQIKELENQYKLLENSYKQLEATLNTPLSYNQMQGILTQIGETHNKLNLLDSKIADTKAKLASDITLKFNNGSFDKDISTLETRFNSLNTKTETVTSSLNETKNALQSMNNAIKSGNIEGLISSYEAFKNSLQKTSNEITILSNREKELAKSEQQVIQSQQLAQKANNLSLRMDNWLKNNSAAASQFGQRIRELQVELQSCDSVKFNGIKSEFDGIIEQAKLAGVNVQTFGDRIKTQLSSLGIYMSGAMAFSQATRALRSMFNNVLEVDTAMTELYRITDLTDEQYSNLYDNMVNSAKEYGSTLDSIINSTANWVRLGFSEKDAVGLSEITTMYQHVTDLDESTAVNNLVTAYKGFEEQLLELNNDDAVASVEMVSDIYDKLGNEFAVSAADVGSGLSKTASALQLAGNTIQESAGKNIA